MPRAEGAKILPVLLKKHGVKLLDMMTYRTKDTDFSAQITKAKAMNPDAIALGACYQQAAWPQLGAQAIRPDHG